MRARRVSIALITIFVATLAGPAAAAHGNLLMSTPADGELVGPLDEIRLEFSTFVIASESTIEVAAINGTQIAVGTVERGESAAILVAPLPEPPTVGRYVVRYDVTASDGDTIAGGYDFEVVDVGGSDPRLTGGLAAVIGVIVAACSYLAYAAYSDRKRRPKRT